jgi:hypothetical protein
MEELFLDCSFVLNMVRRDKNMIVTGKNGSYDVGDLVAENSKYRLRRCICEDRQMLFQIATDASHNAELAKNGWALQTLKAASDSVEAAHKEAGHEGCLNYALGFPALEDSFIFDGQGSRQVNILSFHGITDALDAVVPMLKIWKDGLRVDLQTSAWMLGKLLKTISFAHDNRIQVYNITGNNVLAHFDLHYIVVFDWSSSVVHEKSVPSLAIRNEIKQATKLAISALGGDLDRARTDDSDLPYTRFLQSLAYDGMSDARKAHQAFYQIVDSLCDNPEVPHWKAGFHHFTTFDL